MNKTTALAILELARQFADADLRDVLLTNVVDSSPTIDEIEQAMEATK